MSDHHLLMSLLNRPVTSDQQMMLAFAVQREYEMEGMYVNAVMIRGPKDEDKRSSQNAYTSLIANDINSVRLQGPN